MVTGNQGPVGKLLRMASAVKNDGWKNLLTGLGVSGKDKRLGATVSYISLKESEVENVYGCDDIAGKVVDIIPEEGTREWIEYTLPEDKGGKTKLQEIEVENKRLDVQGRFQKAWNWARLYGGAGIFIAVDDGVEDLTEPLDLKKIRSIKSLTVLTRYELNSRFINGNIGDPNFGFPDVYTISPRVSSVGSIDVHHSRIIRFNGSPLPRRLFQQNNYWDDSYITRLFNLLRNFNLAHDSAASVLQEFKVGVLKIKGLADLIAQDEEQVLRDRIEIMNLSKSVLNTVVLDAEDEDFVNMQTPIAGVDGLLTKVENRLVSATGLPHTIVLGEGAAGFLSGAGAAEKQQFADYVKANQEKDIRKQINQYNIIMQAARQGPTRGEILNDLGWEFKSLFQLNDQEKADLRGKQAVTDQIYIVNGVVDPGEVRESRFGGDEYSVETNLNDDIDMDDLNGEPEEDDEPFITNTDKFDPNGPHGHFDFIDGTFTGSATDGNPSDPNHTHTRANGKQTGPATPIQGGNHIHQDTGDAIPLERAERLSKEDKKKK